MEIATNSHQGPVARIPRGKANVKTSSESTAEVEARRRKWRDAYYASQAKKRKHQAKPSLDARERKRAKARAWYAANRKRILAERAEKYNSRKAQPGQEVRTPLKNNKRPVRAGSSVDALIYLDKAISAIAARDLEGADLFARLTKRVLQGKE